MKPVRISNEDLLTSKVKIGQTIKTTTKDGNSNIAKVVSISSSELVTTEQTLKSNEIQLLEVKKISKISKIGLVVVGLLIVGAIANEAVEEFAESLYDETIK